jgi:hypothetical protein
LIALILFKIKIKEAIEKLETSILDSDASIDNLVYTLYKLSGSN